MVFIPPPYVPPNQNKKKNSPRKTLQDRHNSIRARNRMGIGRVMRTSLGTAQGTSTLKIVLMYSILGMILHWLLPIVIQNVRPNMPEEDAQYYGILGAIVITVFFLVVSLLKGLIVRHRSQSGKSKTQDANTQLFGPKNSER
ncbi:MAG: hypothetical protein OXI67_00105 [Candidatus Poribacteria bacterium]|nr:hypothetical protein [Candidatus Poribacteria bacterium]